MIVFEWLDATWKSVFYKFFWILIKNKAKLADLLDKDKLLREKDFEKWKNIQLMDRYLLSYYIYNVSYKRLDYKKLKWVISKIISTKPTIFYLHWSYSKITNRLLHRKKLSPNDKEILNNYKFFNTLEKRYRRIIKILKQNWVKVYKINTDYIPTIQPILRLLNEY